MWDNRSLDKIASHNEDDWFKKHVLNVTHIETITVLASDNCGTGKTRCIRERLSKLYCEGKAQVGAINIHERVTLTTLVTALTSKFPRPCQKNAVYFSFTYMATDCKKDTAWMEVINQFFLSLLVLRSVHDPSSATTFYLGNGRWDIFIELQALSRDQNEPTIQPREWLRRCIPILSHCGQLLEPSKEYVIDNEARRVCTYLRAYDDGTINRKFEPYHHKRVLFVLDESGSMESYVGTGTALDVAADNALEIFDSHIQAEDVSMAIGHRWRALEMNASLLRHLTHFARLFFMNRCLG